MYIVKRFKIIAMELLNKLLLKLIFMTIIVLDHGSLQAHQWSKPFNSYLFAPGLWSSEHQAAKYCSLYHASTGQKILGKHGFELINGNYTQACNFAEINITKLANLFEAQKSWWPSALFMNVLYAVGKVILTNSNNRYKVSIEGESNNGLTLNPYTLNLLHLNFGQQRDIHIVSALYNRLCSEAFPQDMVLFGVSRGAAAVFNFMALEYPKKPQKRVKAIILESCFDSLENLTCLSYPLSFLIDYSYRGVSPISPLIIKLFVEVCNFYKIPVLFVTSLKDQRVPAERTLNLKDALKRSGLHDFYCLILKHSTHSAYLKDDPIHDGVIYEAVVHAFYKKYGLSYDEAKASAGQEDLKRAFVHEDR